jgi:hypothetical protein
VRRLATADGIGDERYGADEVASLPLISAVITMLAPAAFMRAMSARRRSCAISIERGATSERNETTMRRSIKSEARKPAMAQKMLLEN